MVIQIIYSCNLLINIRSLKRLASIERCSFFKLLSSDPDVFELAKLHEIDKLSCANQVGQDKWSRERAKDKSNESESNVTADSGDR